MLASACPYVSWQCTASALAGTSFITLCSIWHMEPGVPMPMVSPKEISQQPISYSLLATCGAAPQRVCEQNRLRSEAAGFSFLSYISNFGRFNVSLVRAAQNTRDIPVRRHSHQFAKQLDCLDVAVGPSGKMGIHLYISQCYQDYRIQFGKCNYCSLFWHWKKIYFKFWQKQIEMWTFGNSGH